MNNVVQPTQPSNVNNTNLPNNRWWRWRRSRSSVDTSTTQNESWGAQLDKFCEKIGSYLPTVSASTRKAFLSVAALVLTWKLVIWALELVITGACLAVAVGILTCFLKPDSALWLLTEVLPPYAVSAREYLSSFFLRAGQVLNQGPTVTQIQTIAAPGQNPIPRSPRATVSRDNSEVALVSPIIA